MVNFLTNNHTFQILKLNNNGLGPEGGRIVAEALLDGAKACAAAGSSSRLHTVICGRNRLENGSADAWAEAFAAHDGEFLEVHRTVTRIGLPTECLLGLCHVEAILHGHGYE